MRLFSLLAVLSAVLAAAPAHACCIFKCFTRGSAAAPAAVAPAAAPRVAAATAAGDLIWIYTVGGERPDSGTGSVGTALPPGKVEIIVEADPFTSWASSIDLYVTELGTIGPAPAAAPSPAGAAPVAAGEKKRYKAHKTRLKLKQLGPRAAAAAAPGAAPAPASAADAETKWVLELTYIVETDPRRSYSAYAEGDYWEWTGWGWEIGTATSNTITFHTGSAVGSPPGPLSQPAPIPPKGKKE